MTFDLADYIPEFPDTRRTKKPPCFRCGNHLYGKRHAALVSALDGHTRVFHKSCAEQELNDHPLWWTDVDAA